ncbi:synaptotagmin-13 isoform X2 [Microcaecilia unicolor]|uniref:Synaptotagmin-13 isoform X2 n=1 Tax=Microcaecilia unicolor TaxID=1415580 RepID=A0A6P7XMT7_9AMPH|nr:synaptotagmin-13 isoform X2 [Microcaecilia unicolor]
MFPTPLIALGATLGTLTGLLALCSLTFLCKCVRTGKMPLDRVEDTGRKSSKSTVVQPHQQFSIQKSTEPVQPQTQLKSPWICKIMLAMTSPHMVNEMSDDMRKSAEETMTAAGDHQGSHESGGLDQSSEDIFILSTNGEGENGGTMEDFNLEKPLTSQVPKLHYSLEYDCQKAELSVSLLEALVRSSEVNQDTACDCYILGSLTTCSGTVDARTGLVRKASYMTWEDILFFSLTQEEQAEASLCITLWNCDKFSRQSIMGQGKFNVATPCGTDCWVHLNIPEETPAVAEILLSISYLPSANRLIMVLIKARNLHLCTHGNLQGKEPKLLGKVIIQLETLEQGNV